MAAVFCQPISAGPRLPCSNCGWVVIPPSVGLDRTAGLGWAGLLGVQVGKIYASRMSQDLLMETLEGMEHGAAGLSFMWPHTHTHTLARAHTDVVA